MFKFLFFFILLNTIAILQCKDYEPIGEDDAEDIDIETKNTDDPDRIECFGFERLTAKFSNILNLKPRHSKKISVQFYFSTRGMRSRVKVVMGDKYSLKYAPFNSKNPTVVIVHGFMSNSGEAWVTDMSNAFLDWKDVNVIAVDWKQGSTGFKYWRAVANTRTVGDDIASFLTSLMAAKGTTKKDFHLIGHSLGAHICSYASMKLGRVRRITGLDPAQPCFMTNDTNMILDRNDADFVDVIHTNGREIKKLGLGKSENCGDQDFYPNGGMKQPGCHNGWTSSLSKFKPITKLRKVMCNHGRAYELFTESLRKHNCSLIGHKWDLSYSSINASLSRRCTPNTCPILGIRAEESSAMGSFYVATTAESPYCNETRIKAESRDFLLSDLTATTTKPKKAWFKFG